VIEVKLKKEDKKKQKVHRSIKIGMECQDIESRREAQEFEKRDEQCRVSPGC
jgi:hypothetical protein